MPGIRKMRGGGMAMKKMRAGGMAKKSGPTKKKATKKAKKK